MPQVLQQHIKKLVALPGGDMETILSFFKPIELKKKQNILSEGQLCRQHYFVEKGLLRMYYVNEKGVEHTTQFALENWWLTDLMAFQTGAGTRFNIQAVETSSLQAINADDYEKLLDRFPSMEKYFRRIYQKAYAAHQLRIRYIYDFSSEERYDLFAGQNPTFIQRIPQYLLASYLGFTPEYLSELRRKKLS